MSEPTKIPSYFLPAERASKEEIQRQVSHFKENPLIGQLFNAVPDLILLLNKQRQIVFANKSFLNFLGPKDGTSIYGLRSGEVMDCVHWKEFQGCGTTEFCTVCGAAKAIQYCQQGKKDCKECHIIQIHNKGHLDLRVWTTPFREGDEQFTIFVVADISHEKRKMALERIFFHDILNTAGIVNGFAQLLKDAKSGVIERYKNLIRLSSERLIEEIQSQKQLTAAESNELSIDLKPMNSLELLQEIVDLYKGHEVTKGRNLLLNVHSQNLVFTSDKTILKRVIGNMVKNALEASKEGETITLGCEVQGELLEFWVHNPNFMPRDIQLQIFQRSFSTKGGDRGLGTYSMKLLGEKFLNGKVSFVTSEKHGTTFKASYPSKFS